MTCIHAEELISSFIDGEITSPDEASLFAHLGSCVSCQVFLQSMVSLRSALALAPIPEVPSSLERRVRRTPTRAGILPNIMEHIARKRYSVPSPVFAALIIVAAFSLTLSFATLFRTDSAIIGSPQVVYIMNLEPIEVYGTVEHPGRKSP